MKDYFRKRGSRHRKELKWVIIINAIKMLNILRKLGISYNYHMLVN